MISAPLLAQGPRGAELIGPGAIAESLKVLDSLDKRVRADQNDAKSWYRIGMIAWALSDRAKAPNPPRNLDPTRLGRQADTSLRLAAQTAPDNPYYRMMVGKMLLASGLQLSRSASNSFFEQAVDIARKKGDSLNLAEAAVEAGRVKWRSFDGLVNRRIETSPGTTARTINQAMQPGESDPDLAGAPLYNMKVVQEALERSTMALPKDINGDVDYQRALDLFREAYSVHPGNARAFRSIAMALAERNNWTELEAAAKSHTTQLPWDPQGWMALGLATHRLGNSRVAAAAFDSARKNMESSEWARLDRLGRLRPTKDTSLAVRGPDQQRAAYASLYWTFADPLWSRTSNESRVEYLARIAYAEFRWTVDELKVHGADTDRGDIFVRYGPPDIIATVGPDPNQGASDIATFWIYRSGLVFSFSSRPGFATAQTPAMDEFSKGQLIDNQPVRWDNLAAIRVDSMPTQVARFRAAADSVDLYLAAQPPIDSIKKYSDLAQVTTFTWLLTNSLQTVLSDSSNTTRAGSKAWRKRVAPGSYVYRTEASSEGSTRGGRATIFITAAETPASGFLAKGFGMSDLLFATSAEPKSGTAKRWSDLEIAPTAGSVSKSGQLALVWENYDFGQRDNMSTYEVVVTLSRNRSGGGRIAAGLYGALASAARISTSDDKITMAFDRTVAHAPAFVDHVTITLGETPRGNYTVTVQVTDKVSGKTVSRSRNLYIRE